MATILLSIGVLGVAVVLLAARILLVGGEFRGTCGSNSSFLRDPAASCQVCQTTGDEECEYRDQGSARRAGPVADRLTSHRS